MSINLDQIAEIRIQVLNSFENILDIEDVIFISSVNNGKHNFEQGLVPYENLRSISDKYFARKQVVRLIENKTLHKALVHSDQAFFFSFDVVYNVDYCFHFNFNKNTNHLIVFRKNGEIIFMTTNHIDKIDRHHASAYAITHHAKSVRHEHGNGSKTKGY